MSTLHINDAPTTLTRLMNMGVAPFNIASSVILITAQRLARRLCTQCKQPVDLDDDALLAAGFIKIRKKSMGVSLTWPPPSFYGIMKKISRRSDNYGKNDSYR